MGGERSESGGVYHKELTLTLLVTSKTSHTNYRYVAS